MVQLGERHSIGDGQSTLVFLFHNNIRGLFVEANTKTFQFCLENLLVVQWFAHV